MEDFFLLCDSRGGRKSLVEFKRLSDFYKEVVAVNLNLVLL